MAKSPTKSRQRARASIDEGDSSTSFSDEAGELNAPETVVRTEGQRLLLQVRGSIAQIAAAVGCPSKGSVAAWRSGAYAPDDKYRRALAVQFGIPFTSWAPMPNDDEPDEADDETELDDDDDEAELETPGDVYAGLIKSLQRQLKRRGLTPREQAQLTETMQRTLAAKTRLERERELLEDRTIRGHPKWKRLKKVIIDALLAYPDAARSVEEAIVRTIGEDADEAEG